MSPAHTSLFQGNFRPPAVTLGLCSQDPRGVPATRGQAPSLTCPQLNHELHFWLLHVPDPRAPPPRAPASFWKLHPQLPEAGWERLPAARWPSGPGLGSVVLPLPGSWPPCSPGDGAAPAGVTGTPRWGLLSSLQADHSALVPGAAPQGVGTETRRKVRGIRAGRWQRRRSWGGEGGAHPPGVSSLLQCEQQPSLANKVTPGWTVPRPAYPPPAWFSSGDSASPCFSCPASSSAAALSRDSPRHGPRPIAAGVQSRSLWLWVHGWRPTRPQSSLRAPGRAQASAGLELLA